MTEFRYRQFCPLARAAEILGERWTLLILRELSLGPQRFSDLRRRLDSISSSVLTDRLTRLEARGLLQQRALGPPAASTVYELAEAGRAAQPVLRELARWGTRFLLPAVEGDRLEPVWMRAALEAFARREATPARCLEIRLPDGEREVVMHVSGGPLGTRVHDRAERIDATLRAEPLALLGVLTGATDLRKGDSSACVEVRGDLEAAACLPQLFDLTESPLATPPRGESI